MSPEPLASIVITCWNYRAFVRTSIESALAQRYPRTEVVVVDDGSTDGSADVIASYGRSVVTVVKPHGGQGSAFNAGFAASRGDIVCFLDADDSLAPEAIARAVAVFRDRDVVKVHWPLVTIDDEARPLGSLHPAEPLPEGDVLDAVRRGGPSGYVWPVTSGNAWSRRFLERVLPMPEDAFPGAAESYLATLAPAFGPLARLTEPLGTYRMHGGSRSNRRLVSDLMRATAQQYAVLHQALAALGVRADTEAWAPTAEFRKAVIGTCEELEAVLPAGALFGFVEWNQWGPGEIVPGCRAVPMPGRRGIYQGRPVDDDAAIAELERLRADGATHLVFAWPALWWLDHYAGFAQYLATRFTRIAASDRVVVFDLTH